jgi:hypothetical protein
VTDVAATNQQQLKNPPGEFRIVNHSFTPAWKCWTRNKKLKRVPMSTATLKVAEPIGALEPSRISCRNTAALALTIVRDGVITGEGPTTKGRIHFSRALDADDAAWCARILTATAVEHQPVSRAEAEALFEIDDAAAERSDEGRFDDLLAKAVVHHAASASGLPVPPRTVALSPETAIESWAPTKAVGVDTEVLEWIARQMRGKRRSNRTLMRLVATIVGAATLPLAQLPNVFDIGM